MANKRMFNMKIVDSDAFLDMPLSTQCLYFHLNMRADDDGFIGNPKRIMRTVGCSNDDLKLLIAKRFVLTFEDGVIVIKHWKMHNCIQSDRYTPTVYTDEKSRLFLKDNKSYTLDETKEKGYVSNLETKCIQSVSSDIDIDKDIDLDTGLDSDVGKEYIPYQEVIEYLNLKANTSYRFTTKKTQTLIHARFNEGFTLEDFKKVIDIKCSEWNNTNMSQYLRPETLFGTKFEGYLNQKPKPMTNAQYMDAVIRGEMVINESEGSDGSYQSNPIGVSYKN